MGVLPVDREQILRSYSPTFDDVDGDAPSDGRDSYNSALRSRRARHRQRSTRARVDNADECYASIVRKLPYGNRKMRRIRNTLYLLDLVDVQEICFDLSDLLPSAGSAFAKLFEDAEKMKVWHEFIDQPEEKQNELLKQCAERCTDPMSSAAAACEDCVQGEERFNCLQKVLRRNLLCRQPCFEKIELFEDQLTQYFLRKPSGTWKAIMAEGYDRLLLHAVSQWLLLKCFSRDCEGERWVSVKNKKNCFTPPDDSLAAFVKRKRGWS